MKKLLFSALSLLFSSAFIFAQNINFELANPHPQIQDADVGDMEFADLDNDGDLDLVMMGKGGPIATTIYLNNGSGTFTELAQTVIEDVYSGNIGISDVDKDGDLDLLIAGVNYQPVPSTKLYLNDGNAGFTLAPPTSIVAISDANLEFADLDADSDDDLIIMGIDANGDPVTKQYTSDGMGGFTEKANSGLVPLMDGAVELFDAENDGDADLLMQGVDINGNPLTLLYTNDGSGNFSIFTNSGIANFSAGDMDAGDVDGDGDLDVLICGNLAPTSIETHIYLNDGAANFSLLPDSIISPVTFGEVSLNDFDLDGDLDVFVLGTGYGGLGNNSIVGNVFENQGNNTFIFADSLIGGYVSSHAVGDIDGDSDLDLVLGGTTIGTPVRASWLYVNESMLTGRENLENGLAVQFYPNPTAGKLSIRCERFREGRVKVYAVTGELVQTVELTGSRLEFELDQPEGVYFVELTSENLSVTRKVVVRK